MHDDFVKIMRCRFCGKHTNSLALHRQLRSIKKEIFDTEPCEKCKEYFKTYKYFIGDCGHSGFVKTEVLKNVFNEEGFKRIESAKIFRMEKCFCCLGMIKLKDCPTV